MRRRGASWLGLAVALAAVPAAASDDFARGRREFLENCAACHGMDATGGGPMAEMLVIPVPDLTRMAIRRDGRIDPMELVAVIDGRQGVRAHGDPMPIWGSRFRTAVEAYVGPEQAEIMARVRLLELAFYILSIQRGGYPTTFAPDPVE